MFRSVLWRISENARLALIVGLIAGLSLPNFAAALAPWLPEMVAVLLCITALRIGIGKAAGALSDLKWGISSVFLLQMLLPLGCFGLLAMLGMGNSTIALAVVLVTAAPALSGSPNLALLLGQDPGRMMQIMVLGTALFPITVLPVFLLMPQLGAPTDAAFAAVKLLAVILCATGIGFLLREWLFAKPTPEQIKSLDGLSVLAFSAIVIGLMAAVNPALRDAPWAVLEWAIVAFLLSYGIQVIVYTILGRSRLRALSGPLAIGAGNRNIALFLVALQPEVLAPLMVFIGCWQLPMYLAPVLLRWLYHTEPYHE